MRCIDWLKELRKRAADQRTWIADHAALADAERIGSWR